MFSVGGLERCVFIAITLFWNCSICLKGHGQLSMACSPWNDALLTWLLEIRHNVHVRDCNIWLSSEVLMANRHEKIYCWRLRDTDTWVEHGKLIADDDQEISCNQFLRADYILAFTILYSVLRVCFTGFISSHPSHKSSAFQVLETSQSSLQKVAKQGSKAQNRN